jgi:D-alanine-D-alanine ligase
VIGCDSYSRSDFIIKDGEAYFLEVNTLPGLTPESLFPKAAAAIGLEFNHLVNHLVDNARL